MHVVGSLFRVRSPLIDAIPLDRRAATSGSAPVAAVPPGLRGWRRCAAALCAVRAALCAVRAALCAVRAASCASIKGIRMDQGRTHVEKRSNRVRLPLIGGSGVATRRVGLAWGRTRVETRSKRVRLPLIGV
ncbi:hypothetical protein Pa4123_42350 [Phytohabitans aurantiacus]|uniref:Uncharacterized protein n=1 Tax=Phytohabitans aurantiacus TaxID=3016789 RepID=A0ABQ5QXD2_9ACTN|nr:hypothetical protein Pa4123_42350 [Phytohabitans aurantiacus]